MSTGGELISRDKRALLDAMLREKGFERKSSGASLQAISRDRPHFQTSFGQQRIWFFDQYEPATSVYNVPLVLRFHGRVEVDRIERAMQHVIRRHAILRTSFDHIDGALVQLVADELPMRLKVVDLSSEPDEKREDLARYVIADEADRPFDLRVGPLIRSALVKLSDEDSFFAIVAHHVISDGWSMNVLINDLQRAYEAISTDDIGTHPQPEFDYLDYAEWQMKWFESGEVDRLLEFWRKEMSGAPLVLDIPSDYKRPATPTFEGASESITLPDELVGRAKTLAAECDATLFMLLLAAFDVFLMRYTGREDVVVGTVMAGRQRPEFEEMIGFFVNTVVLRTDLSGNPTFRQLVEKVKRTTVDALAHQDLPFERLIMELDPPRDPSRSAVFQVVFALQNSFRAPEQFGDLKVTWEAIDATTAKFDLQIDFVETTAGLEASLTYRTDLFASETIRLMLDQILVLTRSIVENPDTPIRRLKMLTDADREATIESGRAKQIYSVTGRLHESFESVVDRAPMSIALHFEEEAITYGQLDRRANQIAHRLIESGIGSDDRVGILIDRSPDLIASIIAVSKAGGTYVPLDPSHPKERIASLLEDCGAKVVLTDVDDDGPFTCERISVGDSLNGSTDRPGLSSQAPAYAIYTSGSTGKPKGVIVTDDSVLRLLRATSSFDFGPHDVWTMFHSCAFDFSVWEMWGPLITGGSLVVVPSLVARDPEAFLDLLTRHKVTVLNQTPSAFAQLMAQQERVKHRSSLSIRTIIFGGELLDPRLLRDWSERHPGVELVNMYGITETTVHATARRLTHQDLHSDTSPIGSPLPDLSLYLLDGEMNPVPAGVAGEIYVGGAGLSLGYLGRPDLTAERFVPDPFTAGGRLYRSGDLARRTSTGDLIYIGRTDSQMKIRGYRIEPGEIEMVLNDHPSVLRAIVCLKEGGRKGRLTGYCQTSGDVDSAELRAWLKAKLPSYMVPASIVMIDKIPLTPNGKVDINALPDPDLARDESSFSYAPPRNQPEERLAEIWQETLGVERVGIFDNFFDLGGSSFTAIEVVNRAREEGLQLSIKSLFHGQTVADSIGADQPSEAREIVMPHDESFYVPLLPAQAKFFENEPAESHFYNELVVLEADDPPKPEVLHEAFRLLARTHYALRARFPGTGQNRLQRIDSEAEVGFDQFDLSGHDFPEAKFIELLSSLNSTMELQKGPTARIALFDQGSGITRIAMIIHALCIDSASWSILLDDFDDLCNQLEHGEASAPFTGTALKSWADRMIDLSNAPHAHKEIAYWLEAIPSSDSGFPTADSSIPNLVGGSEEVTVSLDETATSGLLTEVAGTLGATPGDLLLSATAAAFRQVLESPLFVELETPGRPQIFEGVDVSATVGRLSSTFPFLANATDPSDARSTVSEVTAAMRSVPMEGVGFGVLRYFSIPGRQLTERPSPSIRFHYYGEVESPNADDDSRFKVIDVPGLIPVSPHGERFYEVEIEALIKAGRLEVHWTFQPQRHDRHLVELMAEAQKAFLQSLVDQVIVASA